MTVIVQTFYISTGAKNAMHTLRMRRDCANMNPNFMPDYYIRNLAVSVEGAQEKALAYFEAWKERVGNNREDFILSLELEPEYDITLRRGKLSVRDTLALNTIEQYNQFPFGKHKGTLISEAPDSYVLYWADQLQKPETANNVVVSALGAICMGVALEKGLIAKREAAKAERISLDAQSVHVGQIGDRIMFTGKVVMTSYHDNEDGTGFWINKVRCDGNLITYIGNKLADRDEEITFKATVKRHDNYKGTLSTVVNRPRIKEI